MMALSNIDTACGEVHQATDALRQKVVRVIHCRRELDEALNALLDSLDADITNVGKAVESVRYNLLQEQDAKITDELDQCMSTVVAERAAFFDLVNQYGAIDSMPPDKKTKAMASVEAAEKAQKRHDILLQERRAMWRCC